MQKIFYIALTLSFMLSLSVNAQSLCCKKTNRASTDIEQKSPVKQAPKQENTGIVKLKITGLTCAGCASHVHKLLNETQGVTDNSVEYPGDIAVIHYNPDQISPELIIKAIEENTSYTAELVKGEIRKKAKAGFFATPETENIYCIIR